MSYNGMEKNRQKGYVASRRAIVKGFVQCQQSIQSHCTPTTMQLIVILHNLLLFQKIKLFGTTVVAIAVVVVVVFQNFSQTKEKGGEAIERGSSFVETKERRNIRKENFRHKRIFLSLRQCETNKQTNNKTTKEEEGHIKMNGPGSGSSRR